MNILFVDDTVDTRELFQMCFTLGGHKSQTAPDGLRALQIIRQEAHNLDVIIMDYHMPGMTGLEVVEQLRREESIPTIPIILFTGDAKAGVETRSQELGIARIMYKPVMPATLIAAAQEVIGKT